MEIIRDHFQNFKQYGIPKAQLIIADIPYNIGKNAYGSNPAWYIDGDNANGESPLAGKEFFDTDKDFRPAEFMHFCTQMIIIVAILKQKSIKALTSKKNLLKTILIFCVNILISLFLIWQSGCDLLIEPIINCAAFSGRLMIQKLISMK